MTEVRERVIALPTGTGSVPGHLAEPADGLTHAGVVVLQEWWGIDAHMRDILRRLAAEGFVALAPDLYHGTVTDDIGEAARLKDGLSLAAGAADSAAAVAHLRTLPNVGPTGPAVVGFCMGGSFALDLAVSLPGLSAVVPFYPGRLAEFVDRAGEIEAPLLGIFGDADPAIPVEVVDRFRMALERAGKPAEIRMYAGADHAFLNDTNPRFHPQAAEDAWRRCIDFLRRHAG